MLRTAANESLWSNETSNIVLLAGMQVILSWKSLFMLLFNLVMGLASVPTHNIILGYVAAKPPGLQSPMDIPTAWLCHAMKNISIGIFNIGHIHLKSFLILRAAMNDTIYFLM